MSVRKRLDLQKFVSPANDKKTAFYGWYLYKHGYSRQMVFEMLNMLGIKKAQTVLDPFCGGGTTLLATSEKGVNSVGYDIMPFAVFVTNAKRHQPKVEEIEKIEKRFTDSLLFVKNGKARFDVETIHKAFTPSVLSFLVTLRHEIGEIRNSRVRNFFLLAFLRTADFASIAKKDGGFLRITNEGVTNKRKVFDYFKKTLGEMKRDIFIPGIRFTGNSTAHLGDSRSFQDEGDYDAVISSPPYPNRHDYTRVYLLEEVLGFGDNNSKIKKLRYAVPHLRFGQV
ncbi:MAG: site-specific DNA-methyltransferase [candidate division Zixibacteria bacterium]|nr:site-specific DNA-methyltransferase [candidate division Zixibacteria bacterium]